MTHATMTTSTPPSPDRPFGHSLMLSGFLVILLFLAALGLWLVYAPIQSTVIAPGLIHAGEEDGTTPRSTLDELPPALYVVASIDARDIHKVSKGDDVLVKLTASNRRTVRPIQGWVRGFLPVQQTDPWSGHHYYRTRIELEQEDLSGLQRIIQPGMGVDVVIRGSVQAPLDFLLHPLSADSVR